MAKKLGRIVHFPNIPLALVTPLSRVNIKQIALRTVPSASKVEDPLWLTGDHLLITSFLSCCEIDAFLELDNFLALRDLNKA